MGHINDSQTSSIKNVLFLGGGKRVSLLERFEQAALKEGIQLKFFCYELREEVHLKDKATAIKGVPFSEMTVSELDVVCNRHNIDLVVPLMDAAVPVCSLYKQHSPSVYLPVPDYELAVCANDKLAFQEWCKKNKVAHYPYFQKLPGFAKGRYSYGSRDVFKVTTKLQIQKAQERGYVIQQFIEGDEFSVDAYVDQKGQVVSAVPRKRLLVSRGEVENSVTVDDPAFEVYTRSILNGRGFSGPVILQFIRKVSRTSVEYWLLEINTRFGGGVILSIEAGMDFPRLMLREMLGRPIQRMTYVPNLLMIRYYSEVFYPNFTEPVLPKYIWPKEEI